MDLLKEIMTTNLLATIAVVLVCAGCATKKPCNLDRISCMHHDLATALEEHKILIMDMMQTIARLENEAGGYT